MSQGKSPTNQFGIRAVIFDVDNTLFATSSFFLDNFVETIAQLGLQQSAPLKEAVAAAHASFDSLEEVFDHLFPNTPELAARALAHYRTLAAEKQYTSTPGAVEAVCRLHNQGIITGILTNRTKLLQQRLKDVGFSDDVFTFICQPPSPELKKPHPRALDVIINALAERGIQPEQTVMVGDHLNDLLIATYRGLHFIAVLQGTTTKEEFIAQGLTEAAIVSDLRELESALGRIEKAAIYKQSITMVSAIDGRHALATRPLQEYFSEFALHRSRVTVEIEHLIALSEFSNGKVVRLLTEDEKIFLRQLATNFSAKQGFEILEYDHLGRHGIGPTEHDVKSCELWLREKLTGTSLADVISCLHMFLTSEDVNNLAYKLMFAGAVNQVFVPAIDRFIKRLHDLAAAFTSDPVMARTHLQPASPTTFGKIFSGYMIRLVRGLERLAAVKLTGKVNGAVGNYNAFVAAYPEMDWCEYSQRLVSGLGFETELWTDQRGPHNDMIRALQAMQEINNVVRDLATDLSLYAAFGTMYFSKIESHVGSSTMPHKINPWFAEVAEGNCKKANYLCNCWTNELDVSRLQRDLSDHDYERSYGEVVGYMLIAIEHLQIALDLIRPDRERALAELHDHPEVVTEALQTILRKHGQPQAYDLLKSAFRGAKPTPADLQVFVDQLDLSAEVKKELSAHLAPESYVGLAVELTRLALDYLEQFNKTQPTVYLKK